MQILLFLLFFDNNFLNNQTEIYRSGVKFLPKNVYSALPKMTVKEDFPVPLKYDLSPLFPPVGNQEYQGSCVAFASGYYLKSYQEHLERKTEYSEDTIFSPAFIYNQWKVTEDCGSGMYFYQALDALKDYGVVSLKDMPYNPADCTTQPSEELKEKALQNKIESWSPLDLNDLKNFNKFISLNIPIFIGITVKNEFNGCWVGTPAWIDYKREGKLNEFTGESIGGHAVVIVGYDDYKQAFKIINSWGTTFCDNGYVWIDYEALKTVMYEAYVLTDLIDINNNPCENVDCSNKGNCILKTNNTPFCECEFGFDYDKFECFKTNYDLCDNYNCSNNGDCHLFEGKPFCNCNEGYFESELRCLEFDPKFGCVNFTCTDNTYCDYDEQYNYLYCKSCEENYIVNSSKTGCELATCSNYNCSELFPNSHCITGKQGEAVCECNNGYKKDSRNNCIPMICEEYSCDKENSHCEIYKSETGDDIPACVCDEGFTFNIKNQQCEKPETQSCSYSTERNITNLIFLLLGIIVVSLRKIKKIFSNH